MTSQKSNKTIHSEGREIISSVIEKCDEESRKGAYSFTVKNATARAAYYTGVSEFTVKKIRKEHNTRLENCPDQRLSTPGKRRKTRPNHTVVSVDEFDRCVIRRIISDFYTVQKKVPTVAKLLPVVKEKIYFPWGNSSLLKIIKEIGFKWKRFSNKRSLLIERPQIVTWRHRYLTQLQLYRKENREIVFIDETWVDSNLTHQRGWRSDECNIHINQSGSKRLIILHAGTRNGFIPNAKLVFKAGLSSGDYHGQMNSVNFEKWINEKLLPNLPAKSIVIMDNAPYHCTQTNKVPSKYAVKEEMREWLFRNDIYYDEKLRKQELYCLIEAHRPKEKTFKIDAILKAFGHTPLRLPPYMCDLNPIELSWAKMKRIIRDNNTTGDLSLDALKKITDMAIESITPCDWAGYENHVIRMEDYYWDKDGITSDIIDSFVIETGGISDDSESASDNSDSEDSETDSELAQPLT